jgi:hypothetical protein
MKIHKIIHGFITQVFDDETQKWISQDFIESGLVEYETEKGETLNETEFAELVMDERQLNLPIELEDPKKKYNKNYKIGF